MKTRIGNAEFDFVTIEELRSLLGEVFPIRKGPQQERPVNALALDGNGNGVITLFTVPTGMRFALHWLIIDTDTNSPASPFLNANGYAEILQAGKRMDFVSFSAAAGGIPATWSSSIGLHFHGGERVEVKITGGPTSATVILRGEGVLEPFTIE